MGAPLEVETAHTAGTDPVLNMAHVSGGTPGGAVPGAHTEQLTDRLEIQANEFPEKSSAAPASSAEHPATSHPWGRSLRKRDPRSWSRYHQRPEPSLDEGRPREVPASRRDRAPVLTTLCGYNPERITRAAAASWGSAYDWARNA